MNGWVSFWHYVIIAALCTYFSLAVVIAIGGFFDVKKMFRRLREAHARDTEPMGPGGRATGSEGD